MNWLRKTKVLESPINRAVEGQVVTIWDPTKRKAVSKESHIPVLPIRDLKGDKYEWPLVGNGFGSLPTESMAHIDGGHESWGRLASSGK